MHSVSQTLLTNNPTWAAHKKDKVLISILRKQTLFSGEIPLQQCVLYSESCSVPAAPTVLALEAQLCSGWSGEGRIRHVESWRFCVRGNRGRAIGSVTEGQTTRGIPDSRSKNQETETKLVCSSISEGTYSPMNTLIQEMKTFHTNEM